MLLQFRWIGTPGSQNPGKTASNGGEIVLTGIGLTANLIALPPPIAPKV